jgi:hypothetical protein
MLLFFVYLVMVFFLNHIVAQVLRVREEEQTVQQSILFDVVTMIAVLLRVPFYLFGIVLYNACCLGTMVAAGLDLVPERATTLWIYVLADNLGYASYALRAFLVREFYFLRQYSQSRWSFIYYDFHRGNGRVFSFAVQPQNGYRMHYVASEVRMRRSMAS